MDPVRASQCEPAEQACRIEQAGRAKALDPTLGIVRERPCRSGVHTSQIAFKPILRTCESILGGLIPRHVRDPCWFRLLLDKLYGVFARPLNFRSSSDARKAAQLLQTCHPKNQMKPTEEVGRIRISFPKHRSKARIATRFPCMPRTNKPRTVKDPRNKNTGAGKLCLQILQLILGSCRLEPRSAAKILIPDTAAPCF